MQAIHITIVLADLFPPRPGNIPYIATNVFKIQVRDCLHCTDRSSALHSPVPGMHARLCTIAMSHISHSMDNAILKLLFWINSSIGRSVCLPGAQLHVCNGRKALVWYQRHTCSTRRWWSLYEVAAQAMERL